MASPGSTRPPRGNVRQPLTEQPLDQASDRPLRLQHDLALDEISQLAVDRQGQLRTVAGAASGPHDPPPVHVGFVPHDANLQVKDRSVKSLHDGLLRLTEQSQLGTIQDMPHTTTASRLRSFRDAHGMTQQRLADLAGVSRDTIGRLERDGLNTTSRTLAAIVRALGVDPATLVSDGEVTAVRQGADSPPGETLAFTLEGGVMVPCYQGLNAWIAGKPTDRCWVPLADVPNEQVAVIVLDDGLPDWPGLLPGDKLVIDPTRKAPRSMEVCVCTQGKRVRLLRFHRGGSAAWFSPDGAPRTRVDAGDVVVRAVIALRIQPAGNF
jgi:DNA-binding XRE family transcriptional regulator